MLDPRFPCLGMEATTTVAVIEMVTGSVAPHLDTVAMTTVIETAMVTASAVPPRDTEATTMVEGAGR